MKLLIITQTVDVDDPVLGFFHNWIEKLAGKFEKVEVICLQKGSYNLPPNVTVHSLGKENLATSYFLLATKLKYIFNFFHLCFFSSVNYDSVFVHMNQEYVLLGGIFWRLLSKNVYLWRNHKHGNLFTRIAVWLSNKVFYTSPESYTAQFANAVQMPVGIDTDLFREGKTKRSKNSILSLGRISPVKNVHLMLEAAKVLKDRGMQFNLDVYGDPINSGDMEYKKKLVEDNKDLIGGGIVNFHTGVSNYKSSEIYNSYEIFINLTSSGSFDKTILEAISCGCIPIIMNKSFKENPEFSCLVAETTVEDVVDKIVFWLKADTATITPKIKSLQGFVEREHNLNLLVQKIAQIVK